MQQKIDLTGTWMFQPSSLEQGVEEEFYQADYNTDHWFTVSIPSSFDDGLYGQRFEESPAWYKRSFYVPESWRGKRVAIRFEGVNFHTKIWVNGVLAGENDDGFLPFTIVVSDKVQYGEMNAIAVYVDNYRFPDDIPGKQLGWRSYGGILREVELIHTDLRYVDRVAITAIPGDEQRGKLHLRILVRNEGEYADSLALSIAVKELDGKVLKQWTVDVRVPDSGVQEIHLDEEIANIEAWSPDHPALYLCQVQLTQDTRAIDSKEVRFGFRSIETRGDKLLLNGQEIFLAGFNRHEDSYRTGMCLDIQLVRQDLLSMKELGANFVRLCHYPHHPRELDLCDEIGLLVMNELPLYWSEDNIEHNQQRVVAAKRQLDTFIHRDENHPSVIFWSVSNETNHSRPEVAAGNVELIQLAKRLDPSRLAVYVLNTWENHMWDPSGGTIPYFEHVEVICINSYPCDRNIYPSYPEDPREAAAHWKEEMEQLHRRYPDKPILHTEFGSPSIAGLYKDRSFGVDVQANAIELQFVAMTGSYHCGAVIWCYADHPWPNKNYGYDYPRFPLMSPYGVVSRDRHPKTELSYLRRMFEEKQRAFARHHLNQGE